MPRRSWHHGFRPPVATSDGAGSRFAPGGARLVSSTVHLAGLTRGDTEVPASRELGERDLIFMIIGRLSLLAVWNRDRSHLVQELS